MNTQATVEQTGRLAETVLDIKANEILKRSPELSYEQAFARAYTDPANSELQKAERRASHQRLYSGDGTVEDLGAARQQLYGGGSRVDDGTVVARSEPVIIDPDDDASIRAWIDEERRRNPYVSDKELLAAIENSPAMRAHRAAFREQVADATRRGSTVPAVAKRDNALNALDAKAEELRKLNPNLSREQAFARVYKANPELAKRERSAAREAIGA